MSLRISNRSVTISFSMTLVIALSLSNWASAQFRDLDKPAAPVKADVDSQSRVLLDLVPTKERFSTPSDQSDPAPTPPKTAPETKLAKPTEIVVPKPEPIPMPELHVASKPDRPKIQKKDESTSPAKPTPVAEEKKQPEVGKKTPSKSTEKGLALGYFDTSLTSSKKPRKPIATKFRGIQPGVTSQEELVEAWGETTAIEEHDDRTLTLSYDMPGLKQVDVMVDANEIVSGLIVHLPSPLTIEFASKELGLLGLKAVPVPDEFGEVLGQAYPECGLLFSFTENLETLRISTVLLEPISGEMFRLRALYDFDHNYKQAILDLEQAIRIDPNDAEAYWMRSQYEDIIGKTRDAMASVQKAIRLQPTNPLFRLTRARFYAKTNRLLTGIDEVKEIIRELDLAPEISGQAHNLLGDMYAIGRKADHQLALKHHLRAIDDTVKAVEDRRFAVRRAAKIVLVNAHVSVARDIAMGNFQRQPEVVPKWLLRATEMADEFISDDQGDELLQMQIFRDTLSSYAEIEAGSFDVAIAMEEAMEAGREMIEQASDEFYKIQIERMLAETLFHAAKIHRSRGRYDEALQFANNALGLLENSKNEWETVAHDRYLEGQLYFLIGSVHALRDQHHDEAVSWYVKARRLMMSSSSHATSLFSNRSHGEMYVSMGLSYWEDGKQEEAMRLTMQGAEIMKDAVEKGTLPLKAMSVPYGNLATMHSQLGNSSKSQEFAKLVARIDALDTKKL